MEVTEEAAPTTPAMTRCFLPPGYSPSEHVAVRSTSSILLMEPAIKQKRKKIVQMREMGIHDCVVLKLRMHIQIRKLPTQISSFYSLLEYMDGKTGPTTRSLYAFVSLMSFVCYRQ